MYSKKNTDGKESNTAKRVNIVADLNECKETLFNKKVFRHKMRRIQSKEHQIGKYEGKKVSLPYFDDKRFVLDDGIHGLANFHKDCEKQSDVPKDSHRW